jgi:hypothetical protein
MEIDRKTQRELNKLNKEAHRLWEEQREVLTHARDVALDATRAAGSYTKREVLPKAQETYQSTIAPLVGRASSRWAKPQKTSNPLTYVLMAIGAIALAAITYAAWQTLRADDDLWIEQDGE